MSIRYFVAAGFVWVGGLGGRLAHGQTSDDPRVKIAGDWRYDALRSEELADKMPNRVGGLPGIGPRPGGIGGGTGGRGGRGGRGAPEGGVGMMGPEQIGSLFRAPYQLAIETTDSTVVMRVDLGVARPLFLDGRTTVDTLGDMTPRSSTAKWHKNRLEVERKVDRGGRIRETYWLDVESNSLVVDVRLEGMPRTIELRRIYSRAAP
ncbi:MAG: hypothetical protein JNJ80_02180 [Gemmatimonadetes bacterium]|nr:hypothetical protein [Gemmatimonadota bacterium]MCC7131031.1 hypothetical protein [Gemmatimonadales bacterium]